jgi:hypothetical protein
MIKVEEFIPEVFLMLTSKTYPHGYEDVLTKWLEQNFSQRLLKER